MNARPLELWEFWYQLTEDGIKHSLRVKECKAPERTSTWKNLLNRLDNETYHAVGYRYLRTKNNS